MKHRHELTELEWELLAPLIPRAATGRLRVSDRQVINGMVYRIRTGISWRDLPTRRIRTAVLATVCVVPLLGLGLGRLLPDGDDGGSADERAAALGGWVTIRPARTPEFCLSRTAATASGPTRVPSPSSSRVRRRPYRAPIWNRPVSLSFKVRRRTQLELGRCFRSSADVRAASV
ncbi:transposase [Streptomyces mutabilis]|uniref:transposase n=1 Tax=Streptomyces mutabilis TaxID=67332 RepID=UPI0034DE5DD4